MTNIYVLPEKSRFPLGEVYVTAGVAEALHPEDIAQALARHACRDWGEVCEEDRALNESSLLDGSRLHSVYRDRNGVTFWILTEADRSATTVVLPDDY